MNGASRLRLSFLALRTVEARALSDHSGRDGFATDRTGFPRLSIDIELLGEITRLSLLTNEIP